MSQSIRRVVVVHRGARDGYEVAAGLAGAGLLEKLITDLYWPEDRRWAAQFSAALPVIAGRALRKRNQLGVPASAVRQKLVSGFISFALERIRFAPAALKRGAIRWTDATIGREAGEVAARTGALLLSYSYYGYAAFKAYRRPGFLFQLHPHPLSVRQILERERTEHPDCSASLNAEWELSLSPEDFARLVAETKMASHFVVASSFTRRTLIEHGASPEAIRVLPYGVDLAQFTPSEEQRPAQGRLRLLFVGTISQRKGIKYLLEALRLIGREPVELTVCGRVVDDLSLFKPFGDQVEIRPSVSQPELLAAYRSAHLFVFPSVAEGFGHVLLEALASGLPVIGTTHTAAPDLIEEGSEGFLVEPRRPELIAERIEWAIDHPSQLAAMGRAARRRAECFTWSRFRSGLVDAIRDFAPGAADQESWKEAKYV